MTDEVPWYELIGSTGAAPQHHLGGKRATDELIDMAGIQPGNKVLVLGCGDGSTALAIARRFACKVTGTDINPEAVNDAMKNLEKARRGLKGKVVFKVDDLFDSKLKPGKFDRIVVESVLIMLPKGRALEILSALLAPEGVLVMNEGLRMLEGDRSAMESIQRDFEKIGVTWGLPTYDEWRALFEKHGFMAESSGPRQTSVIGIGVDSFIRNPLASASWFFRVMVNGESRRFFIGIWRSMAKARIKWGYALWACHK